MQYDTAGNLIIFYDMCAYCHMGTGGQHESHCPLAQSPLAGRMVESSVFVKLVMRGLEDLTEGKFSRREL